VQNPSPPIAPALAVLNFQVLESVIPKDEKNITTLTGRTEQMFTAAMTNIFKIILSLIF
jgi:hypothetical protein